MKYLLDTGPLTAYLRGRAGAVAKFDTLIQQGEVGTSILVYGEIMEFFQSFSEYANLQAITRGLLYNKVKLLYLPYAIEERFARLRRSMRQVKGPQGGLIGDIDTLIAATAIDNHLTLITLDSDYNRVPGLTVNVYEKADMR